MDCYNRILKSDSAKVDIDNKMMMRPIKTVLLKFAEEVWRELCQVLTILIFFSPLDRELNFQQKFI